MPTSASSSMESAKSRAEIELEIQQTQQKLVELEKSLEAEKRREKELTNKKKRKYDELMGLPNPHSIHRYGALWESVLVISGGITDTSVQLWQERQKTYYKIRKALVDLSKVQKSSFPFDCISLEELEAVNKIWSCVNSDNAAIQSWKQPLLDSIHDKIIALRDKVENHEKQTKVRTKPEGSSD